VKWNRWIVPARRGQPRTTTYERGNGKGEKAKNDKQTFWCIRADVVRKLDRGEPEKASTALVCLLTISVESVTSLPSGDSFRQHPFRARSIVAMQPIFAIPREITSVHHSVVDRML